MMFPVGLPLLAYAGGMVLAWYHPQWRDAYFLCTVAATPAAMTGFLFSKSPSVRNLSLVLAVFLLGAVRTSVRLVPEFPPDHLVHETSGAPILLEGMLWDEPVRVRHSTRLPFRAERVRSSSGTRTVKGKADLFIPASVPELRVGDVLLVEARLQLVRNLGNPGEMDRRSRSFLNGVYVKGSVKDPARILRLGAVDGYGFLRWVQGARMQMGGFFRTDPDSRAKALLRALILGDRSELTENLQDSFMSSGLVHLLSISGLHVALVGLFVYGVAKGSLRRFEWILLRGWLRKLSVLLSLPFVLLYVLLAGSPVTGLRAACMALCFAGSLLIDRPAATWNALGLAALFLLVSDPSSLFSISFLLSFASVAAILSVLPIMRSPPLRGPQEVPYSKGSPSSWLKTAFGKFLWPSLVVTIAATLATLPLCAYFFHQISLVGVVANLAVVPFVSWAVMPLGFLSALCFLLCAPVAPTILEVAAWTTEVSIQMVELFSRIPQASIRVVSPSLWEILLFYASLLLILMPRGSLWKRKALSLCLAGLCLSFGYTALSRRLSRDLEVTFLSVGQGESILVVLPGGKTILLDGGMAQDGFSDAGRWVVGPFLGWKRIRRLDWMVVSHGHPDHYGGLRFLAKALQPREIWTSPPSRCDEPDYREFLEFCSRIGIRRRLLCGGLDPISLHGVNVEILNPPCNGEEAGGAESGRSGGPNNQSLVLRLTYGAVRILLTGDIEKAVESRLLDSPESLSAQVLKVPHHGSRVSSSPLFLDAVSPKAAVVSVGYRNAFGFPAPEAVGRYEERGIPLFRTDLDGAVLLRTDGRRVEIRPHRGYPSTFVVQPSLRLKHAPAEDLEAHPEEAGIHEGHQ